MVERVCGDADDGAGGEVVRVDGDAPGEDDAGEVRRDRGGAAESLFNACVEISARVELWSADDFVGGGEGGPGCS